MRKKERIKFLFVVPGIAWVLVFTIFPSLVLPAAELLPRPPHRASVFHLVSELWPGLRRLSLLGRAADHSVLRRLRRYAHRRAGAAAGHDLLPPPAQGP